MFYNTEIEQYYLGQIFGNPSFLLSAKATSSDFMHPEHGDIFNFMAKTISEKKTVSNRDFALWAEGKTMAGIPAYEYIREVTGCLIAPMIEQFQEYENVILELSRKRKIQNTLDMAATLLKEKSSVEIQTILSDFSRDIVENNEIKSCSDVRKEIAMELAMPLDCQKTGLQCLDDAMGGGLYQGFTYGFCGAEKAGKTTMANSISFKLDCPHLYIAMEMGKKQIEQRNVARQLGFNSIKFLGDSRGDILNSVETAKANDNVFYVDLPGGTIDQILFHVGTAIMKYGIKGFILDYWQLVGGKDSRESEEKHLRDVAQNLANFSRKQKIFCILLAQMNKNGELFGGNGIRKACDQLYMIEFCPEVHKNARWLRMDASRYTFKADVGSETQPSLWMETHTGPFFRDVG